MAPKSTEEMVRQFKQKHPSSHIFKIENFSLLLKHHVRKCESSVFQIAGYRWKLILYPNGNEDDGGKLLISLYLAMEDPSSLPHNSQVFVNLKLFALNQLNQNIVKNHQGMKCFTAAKSVWGTPYLISVATFTDASEGYLVDDSCLFGAELLGVQPVARTEFRAIGTAECFTMIEKPQNKRVTWKITGFSTFDQPMHESHEFLVGGRRWKILVSPKGVMEAKDNSLSVFLKGCDYSDSTAKAKTYAKYKLRVLDQLHGKHVEKQTDYWYGGANDGGFGFWKIMPLKVLHDPSKGYVVNDTLYVGVDFEVVSTTTYL